MGWPKKSRGGWIPDGPSTGEDWASSLGCRCQQLRMASATALTFCQYRLGGDPPLREFQIPPGNSHPSFGEGLPNIHKFITELRGPIHSVFDTAQRNQRPVKNVRHSNHTVL